MSYTNQVAGILTEDDAVSWLGITRLIIDHKWRERAEIRK